jgi:stearoyl-CoA desaturase (delta-9 desaturase)
MKIWQDLANDFNTQLKVFQLSAIVLSIFGIVNLITNFSSAHLYITIICATLFSMIGVNVGLHRYFSHRSFDTWKPVVWMLGLFGTLSTTGRLISWVAIHRFHHLHTDTELDPHSPKYIGWLRSFTFDYTRVYIDKKYVKDLLSNSTAVFFHKNCIDIILIYIFILSIVDPWLVVFAWALPSGIAIIGLGSATLFGHTHGYVSHNTGDNSRNSWISSILSLGDGWHNNHHAHPYRYCQTERWWELDPPAWIIKLIKKNIK